MRGVLARIVALTTAQLDAFRQDNRGELMRLDRDLENAMGEKERNLGALYEHRKEHGVNPTTGA
ncbi:MAG: hypothetical protein ACRD30_03330 [Bryobacteraceae bacterium]